MSNADTARSRIATAAQEAASDLDLSGLGLTELPWSLGKLSALKSLDLQDNRLNSLPVFLKSFRSLRTLLLDGNQFSSWPEILSELPELASLHFRNNRLVELPHSVANLSQLGDLDISGNPFPSLPQIIRDLTGLRKITLRSLRFKSLPEWMVELTNLEEIDLTSNQLTAVPDFSRRLRHLSMLVLTRNRLTSLPEWIGDLRSLERLDLEENELTDFPEGFGDLSELSHLWLGVDTGGNPLGRLPRSVRRLTKLTFLSMDSCSITELPEWIGELRDLRSLYAGFNQISDLPRSLADLSDLHKIFLEGNPLNPELAAANAINLDAVRAYLRERSESRIVLNEGKLILIGEGKVGKSSLLGALCGETWIDGRPTTHGVEIKRMEVTNPSSGKKILLNGWDFGGQPLYRPTHQLFFTAPAVYLVVWDPRVGPKQSAVEEWIKMVKHRASDERLPEDRPRIIVVATHGGPKERRDYIDEHALRSQFGDLIVDFHHVDSFTGDHLDELKATIAQTAAALPHVGRTVATSWKRVLDAVRERSDVEPYILYAQFEALCAEHGVEEELARVYASFLNELGYLIHYADDPWLKDTMILKADWLSKAISFVLEDQRVKQQNGLVEHERLQELWNDLARPESERYPAAIHPIFLRLMERFDLSYPVVLPEREITSVGRISSVPEGTSLVAQLVPGGRPSELSDDWPAEPLPGDMEKVQVCRIVDAETKRPAAAEGLLYRLIVRLHRYSLGRTDYRRSRHWQSGLLLDDTYNGRALFEEIGGDIRVTVRAAYPERLLHHFCEEVKWLVDNFWKGLDCLITIPCCPPPCQGSLEIRKLIEGRRMSPRYPCPACSEWHDIDDLLASVGPAPESRVSLADLTKSQAEIKAAVENGFQSLSVELRRGMSQADEQFAALMKIFTDEAKDGPRLFSFVPADPGFLDRPKWSHAKFRLTLWCEHSRLPLPQLNGEGDKRGVYEIELPKSWIIKAAPFLKMVTGTLSLVYPVASSATKLMLDDAAFKGIEEQLDLGQKSLDSIAKGAEGAQAWAVGGDKVLTEGDAVRAEGGMLRELHALLREKDASFGGLLRVQNKRREFVWVHPQFVSEY
jgi:Leucine-rich repeat (LRR) protein